MFDRAFPDCWGERVNMFDCLNFNFLLTSNSQGKTLQRCERKLNNCLAETFILEYFSMNFDTWQWREGRRRRININVKAVVPEFGIHYCIRHQGVQFVLRQKSDDNTAQLLSYLTSKQLMPLLMIAIRGSKVLRQWLALEIPIVV